LVVDGKSDGRYLDSVVSLGVEGVLSHQNKDVAVSIPRLPDVPNVLGRQKRKTALEKWVKEATKVKKDCLADIEIAIARANAQYAKKKGEAENRYKQVVEEIENDYQQKLEKITGVSDSLVKEVDDKLEDAKEQIEDLEKRLEGAEKTRASDPLLCCPITGDIMEDPVMAADGHTYERSAIEEVFAQTPRGQVMSPATNTPLTHRILMPNVAVQAMVTRHQKETT